MRDVFCESLLSLFNEEQFVFLTGDLGFMTFEPLKELLGDLFINAGVAEQNMASAAAGLSLAGFKTWVYSIAPFVYARPFEQIRNDICFNGLAVKLVGNGGGYGYGAMGSSHHAIEDYGALLTLKGMTAFVPAFAQDVQAIVPKLAASPNPAYLRLGKCEKPKDFDLPDYAPWRRLTEGTGPVILVIGPLAGVILGELLTIKTDKWPEVWVLSELPIGLNTIPEEFIERLYSTRQLIIIEEHVEQGGLGQMMAHWLLNKSISLKSFDHLCARGYPSGLYGSQEFHRNECGLSAKHIVNLWRMRFEQFV